MSFKGLAAAVTDFLKTERGKKVLKWSQRVINLAILVWLIYQLSDIGWLNVWQSFPTNPLFYVLFLLTFLQLPLFEVLIYRLTWSFDAIKSIPVFILKRVYNKDVIGYSGEVYFFIWAKKNLHKRGAEVFKIIKDNNIISSVASTLVSFGLLAAFIFTDQIKIIDWLTGQNRFYLIAGALFVVVLVLLFIRFRHYVISMPLKTAYKVFGIQIFRLLLIQVINLLMFYIVLPEVPLHIWFTYIAVSIILSRIPFLPSKDFIFAGIGISMAGSLPIPQDAIAGIMIALGALNKISGFIAFGLTKLINPQTVVSESANDTTDTLAQFNKAKDRVETEDDT